MIWNVRGLFSEPIIGARRCINFCGACSLIFTMGTPDSLQFAKRADEDATMSGWIIATLQFGVGSGSFAIWVITCFTVDGSLKNMRGLGRMGSGLRMLGTCAYAVMAWSPRTLWSLIGARYTSGLGIGITTAAGRYFINRTALGNEIKDANTNLAFLGLHGLGDRPFLGTCKESHLRRNLRLVPSDRKRRRVPRHCGVRSLLL